MGWSLPNVPAKNEARPWSPWVCLLIIFIGVFIALMLIVLHSPPGGSPSLASGYWLTLTVNTLTGITIGITLYLLWWETQSFGVWNWNGWRQNMHLAWRREAHQHLCVVRHVTLTADPQLFTRLAGAASDSSDEKPPLILLPDEPFTPGISRFEQLCQLLIDQMKDALLQCGIAGTLTIIIQTSSSEKERELQSVTRLWSDNKLPGIPAIHTLSDALPFGDWNHHLSTTHHPVLILALHYRQPGEALPEFASALLLALATSLTATERQTTVRLFRAMPLNSGVLMQELKELRDMAQQPAGNKYVVWHYGLATAPRQGLGRVLTELALPLHDDIGTGGLIDFDKVFGDYGNLAGGLMMTAAVEMVSYGPESHWLLCENDKEAWAVVLGNRLPAAHTESAIRPPAPYPAGSIMLALLLIMGIFGAIAQGYPSWLFSWGGTVSLLLSLVVVLPGMVFILRNFIAYLQRPKFIKAARQFGKE